MNGAEAADRPVLGPAIATVLTHLALGPPIGGLVFATAVAFEGSLAALIPGTPGSDGGGGFFLIVALFAVPFSYFFGGLQALIAGLAIAAYGWRQGRPPLWVAALVGLAVFACAHLLGLTSGGYFWPLFFIHMIPALVCGALSRLYWRPAA